MTQLRPISQNNPITVYVEKRIAYLCLYNVENAINIFVITVCLNTVSQTYCYARVHVHNCFLEETKSDISGNTGKLLSKK